LPLIKIVDIKQPLDRLQLAWPVEIKALNTAGRLLIVVLRPISVAV